jgi:hypothetical protein
MGEAVYYAKIKYKSPKAAKEALPVITELFHQGVDAANYWQNNRGEPGEGFMGRRGGKTQNNFWKEFENKFPMVADYLKFSKKFGGDKNNALAGQLDFGEHEDIENIRVDGEYVLYSAEVWHFANWDPLLNYVVKTTKAIKQSWLSDEYANIFDELD